MFKIEQERCDYGKLLAPPQGYELENAVGTTYSLDLETLTLTAIAVGLAEDTDSMLKDNPISLLNALLKVTDKVVLFYEAGHIKTPPSEKTNNLYKLLEKTTIPIALTSNSGKSYPSFHPKMWLLCYKENESNSRFYRFIVMSRNLTFDRSWDVAVALEGYSTKEKNEKSTPIANFMRFLSKFTEENSRGYRIINMLRTQVSQVKFSLEGTRFTDFTIMPMGIGRNRYDIEQDKWLASISNNPRNFHEIAIMSPFISGDVIELFNDPLRGKYLKSCKRTLITRASELNKLKDENAGNFDIYTLRDEIIDGENGISEDEDKVDFAKQDIHAKMMLVRKDGIPSSLYLGSMNFSHNGFYRNVEMDIRFDCPNSYLGPDSFLKDIFGENPINNPFVQRTIEYQESDERENNELDLKIKRICRANGRAIVKSQGEDCFSLQLEFNENMIDEGLTIKPLGYRKSLPVEKNVVFDNLTLMEITEYYRVDAKDEEGNQLHRILQIQTDGIPPNRDKQICNSIIDSRDKFYEYISFILGDDKIQSFLEAKDNSFGEGFNGNVMVLPAIYEKMLEASLHHRERFKEIRDIMKMLPDNSPIVSEFEKLYTTFCNALKINVYE